MDIYKGEIKCIQFKDRASYNKIRKLLKRSCDDEDYKLACRYGILINHANRLFLGEYMCEYKPGNYMKMDKELMENFKKDN